VLSGLDLTLAALDSALKSSLAHEAGERIRASGLADTLEPLIARAADSAEAERLVGRVVDSRVLSAAVQRLLETEALWTAIDEIAQSPAVTEAISRQGLSFADQMANVVRQRSGTADDRLERLARRLVRRPPPVAPPAPGPEPGP
jgi:hypothetical protein